MGKRSHGGQKKRYKDTLKASLKRISTRIWEQIAQDRAKWRGLIRKGASEYETERISIAEQKVHSAKPELRHHQQDCLALTSVVPSATDSLELELVYSVILEHTNISISRM